MKKGLTMLLALLLCAAVAVGGMAQSALSFTPGTYTGEATGFGGAISVAVTVDEGAIVSV